MANEIIKSWDIYVGNRKVGVMQTDDVSIDAPGVIEQAADGAVGRAQAPVTTNGNVKVITIWGGTTSINTLLDACLSNTPVKLTHGPIGGKLWTIDRAWIKGVKASTDFTSGQAFQDVTWDGVAPKITNFGQ